MAGDKHDASYYGKCMIGGLLACGLTHTAIVPLDVMKCKKQADPNFKGGLATVRAEGKMTLDGLQLSLVTHSKD